MVNVSFELERLKASLRSKGTSEEFISIIVAKAEREINDRLMEQMDSAMDNAVQSGVQKDSAEFINDLRPAPGAFQLETSSGNTDFSEPPLPMLDRLLAKGAKPMKDGSGVYKVIPVGAPSKQPKPQITSNIFDSQKAIAAERYENAITQYNKVKPKGSKIEYRAATSKQDRATQWVLPAKDKDFTEDLKQLNNLLDESHDSIVMGVIRSYEEGI